VLVTLIIPATLALATFYLSNKKLSHSLIATVKIGSGLYKNEHQNIEISFHEIDAGESDIRWDMEIKFPPQFEQLLKDLCEDKNDKLFVTQDAEHNTILKLSANIHLKNGFKPLRNEIRGMLATSIQGFTEAMGELLKLDKKDITYDKLKELLNEFRLKAVNSVDPKLTSYLIQDAYRVAFIQAIKFAQGEGKRRGDFVLEERLKEVLVEQELKSQGKELPTEKEMIKKDLGISNNLNDKTLPSFRAKRRKLITEGKIAEKKVIDVYKDIYPEETREALKKADEIIKELKSMGEERYKKICEKLKEVYENRKNGGLKDGALKRKLEDLFKFEPTDQYVYRELIKSRIRKAEVMLNQSDLTIDVKQSLLSEFRDLNVDVCSHHEINLLLEKMHSEITKCKTQSLFQEQGKSVKDIEDNTGILMLFNGEDEKRLVKKIVSYREEIRKYLTQPARVKEIIEKQNKDLDVEKNSEEKESPAMELIELCLKNNQEILKALEDLESEKEGLLINEKTKNDYREELTSREKIKFAIIEDDLLEIFKQETFNEVEIKELLEKAELEYCLAEKCIKYPVIKIKDNIKHFCHALLSPLIGNLVEKIINHIPKDNKSSAWNLTNLYKRACIAVNYNTLGLSAIGGENSTEGKALKVAHDTYKEVETFLQYFESSYKEVGGLIGNVFSDGGETFKKDI
jgi:flagellin-specific chaperone FliS